MLSRRLNVSILATLFFLLLLRCSFIQFYIIEIDDALGGALEVIEGVRLIETAGNMRA